MIYTMENNFLRVSVTTDGAQICSVIRKSDGVEHIWQADPEVWGYHGPILFPYAGKLVEGKLQAKGRIFEGKQHGFARLMEHRFVRQSEHEIILELTDTPETLAQWPYRFRLESRFILDGDRLTHRLTVENRDGDRMPFGIGYHPAFALPFDDRHTAEDYELRFDRPQSPLCIDTQPTGLLCGRTYYLGKNTETIPLTKELFAVDSHCMAGLSAKTLGLYEKDSTRGVECELTGFPFTLIWSKPDWPMRYVCIEPWMSLPGAEGDPIDWESRAAAAVLAPGAEWHVDLNMRFVR